MKKQNFLKISLKGTFVYIILVIVLSIIYSKLVVIIPKFVYLNYSKIKKSDITQRVNNDAEVYSDFFNSIISLFLDTLFIIGFSINEILKLSFLIGVFIFVICLLIILLSLWYFKISKPLVEDIVDKNESVIKKTTNSIINSKMLKAFNRQDDEKLEFKRIMINIRKAI